MDHMDQITAPLELLLLLMTGVAWWLARRDLVKLSQDQQTPTLEKINEVRKVVEELLDEIDEKIEILDERIGAAGAVLQELAKKPAPQKAPRSPAAKAAVAAAEPAKIDELIADVPVAPDSRYNEVFALAEAGLSCDEIARRTGLGSAEVEMVISLRPI